MNPGLCDQLIFNKGSKSIQRSKYSLFINGVGRTELVSAKKNETRSPSYTIHQNKLKWIKDLNISGETIKILEENTGVKI